MVRTTKCPGERVVKFKYNGASNMPYNQFSIRPGASLGDMVLVNPYTLGLNESWLRPQGRFPYGGYRIHDDVKKFNDKARKTASGKRRVLFYDIRHGEADHNKLKKLLPDKWAGTSESRKCPTFEHDNVGYCTIDPPLTGQGREDAKDANKLFKDLKKNGFPMPQMVFISPLYRAVETFELALEEGLGIDLEHCYVVMELREQETGNGADILIREFVNGEKRPPPPGSGKIEDWMEPDNEETHENPKVEARVREFLRELPKFQKFRDCDRIARVTHSLLNRHTLKDLVEVDESLEVGESLKVGKSKRKSTVMDKFMLDEGGSFLYVMELDMPKDLPSPDLKPNLTCYKYNYYRKTMSTRRKTAFPFSDKACALIPRPVQTEEEILKITNPIQKQNVEHKKPRDNDPNVKSQVQVGSGNANGRRDKVVSKENVDGGNNVDTKNPIGGRINVSGSKIAVPREHVGEKKNTGTGGNKNVKGRVNVDHRRNIGSNASVGSRMNVSRQKNDPRSTCQNSH